MSLRAVHAGEGYRYLLRSVATNDAPRTEGQALSDYYAAKGTPPGRWIGAGLTGLASENAVAGAQITEEQMAALYGEGLHPDADELMEAGASVRDCQLGRAFRVHTGGKPVLEALARAEKAFVVATGRRPSIEERSEIAEQVGRPFYRQATGYDHAAGADVIAWVNRERAGVKQAVAGFDLTFSPVKSVSVLWALADREVASRIAALHHEAVAETLAWAEANAIYTRRGNGGLEQVKTTGVLASEFTHFDTRGGDPDLHSHVLVSNKVQDVDGSWKSLDSKALLQQHQALSARYDAALYDRLTREMGLEFVARHPSPDKAPVWEIAGVDARLCDRFSSRRRLAKPVYDRLVADYVERTGRQPGQRAAYALWQDAILETRDAKKPAQSLDELRARWRTEAEMAVGADVVAGLTGAVRGQEQVRPVYADTDAARVAAQALRAVTAKRSTYRRSHVDTAVAAALKGYRFRSDAHRQAAHDAVVQRAIDEESVCLTPPEVLSLPGALTAESGAGIDRRANAEWYTTEQVLAAEDTVLGACAEPVAVLATRAETAAALAAHDADRGWSLNTGQQMLAEHLVGCGTLVAAGVGPAGTGKSAAMQVVADAWRTSGKTVIGLAPSAAAAGVLGEGIGAPAHTIDALVHTWCGRHPGRPARELAALPIEVPPGSMLLVDEAGMASALQLAALTEIARAAGAVVRLVGDPGQLDAVTGGGLFAEVCRTPGTPQLREVMRMGADRAQADATLALRDGEPSALDFYEARDWVTGGTREAMLTAAVAGYTADTAAGRRSLLVAATNADVDTLNEIIRSQKITAGEVDTTGEVRAARGDVLGVGDTVLARRNQMLTDGDTRLGRVTNGQLFTVTSIRADGALVARDQTSGAVQVLPAEYVREHVHLGYAATVHRAQGATVDTTHAVVDASMDRAGLYVAMTRGKRENRAYTVCESDVDASAEDAHLHSAGDRDAPTAREVLETVLARDTRNLSATETLRAEAEHAGSRDRLEALYRHGVDLAAQALAAATLPDFLDALPRVVGRQVEDDPDLAVTVRRAWTDHVRAGGDPRELTGEIIDALPGARDPGARVVVLLREATAERTSVAQDAAAAVPGPAPRVPGADVELGAWLATTYASFTAGVDEGEPVAGTAQEAPVLRVAPPEVKDRGWVCGVDLDGVDLRGVALQETQFVRCSLRGARLDRSVLTEVSFQGCDLTGAAFTGAAFAGAELHRSVPASGATRAVFFGCTVQGMDLTDTRATGLEFVRCRGDQVSVGGAVWDEMTVRESRLGFLGDGFCLGRPDVQDSTVTGPQFDLPDPGVRRGSAAADPGPSIPVPEDEVSRVASQIDRESPRRLSDGELAVERTLARRQVDGATRRVAALQRSAPQGARREVGPHEQSVLQAHARLDEQVAAIHAVGTATRTSEGRRGDYEFQQAVVDGLTVDRQACAPWSWRTRRELDEALARSSMHRDRSRADYDHACREMVQARRQAPLPEQWERILTAAADTSARDADLSRARARDAAPHDRAVASWHTEHARAVTTLAWARSDLEALDTEKRRRAGFDATEQAVEVQARAQFQRGEHEQVARVLRVLEVGTPTSLKDMLNSGSSLSTYDQDVVRDTGPELDTGPDLW